MKKQRHNISLFSFAPELNLFSLILAVSLFGSSAKGKTLSLDEVLSQTRKTALESMALQLEEKAFQAEAAAIKSVYDAEITSKWHRSDDDGAKNLISEGTRRLQSQWETHYRKTFATGTSLDFSTTWQRQEAEFPIPLSTLDPVSAPRFNPIHETLIGISVRQSLWRNRLGREVDLLFETASLRRIEPQYKALTELQNEQGEAELLYWQLIALNEQIAISQELLATSKEFARSMKRRVDIGRADEVELAAADSVAIVNEAELLDLQIQRERLMRQFFIRLYGRNIPSNRSLPDTLPKASSFPLPVQEVEAALRYADRSRMDLKLLREQSASMNKMIDLAREKGKPDIGFFAGYHKRGLGDDLNASFQDLSHGTLTTFGFDVTWNLGQTTSHKEIQAAAIRKQSTDFRIQNAIRTVSQYILASFEKLKGAERQWDLAKHHIEVLEKKKASEERKLRQARSDEVAILRYQLEVLQAHLKRVNAQLNYLLTESEIRNLIHAYPTQVSAD